MAQLNKFIQVLHERNADLLTLVPGEPIVLTVGGASRPLSRSALTETNVLALVSEITPPSLASRVTQRDPVNFSYAAPTGAVDIMLQRQEAGVTVAVRPGGSVDPPALGPEGNGSASGSVTAPVGSGETFGRAALNALLEMLVKTDGSDLHLRVGQPVVVRRDGRLVREGDDRYDPDRIASMLQAIMPEKDRRQHEETGDADFAYEIPGLARFRVNAARDRGGPMAVLRVIPSAIPTCDQMAVTREVRDLCYLSKGLVVVTGPTGSGKSTTLAALVNLMNEEREEHILTIEDPVEFVHESKSCLVTHRQVGLHTRSFKSGLRAALREDPDIILIGELRDLETVEIAIETAETGHLVFGTLHTTTAASTVDRMIDQFPPDRQAQIRVMLSESLRGVISQTLCRRIGGGRVAAREILLTTPAVSNLIREGKTFQLPSIIQTSKKLGMMTLNDALLELVDQKVIEPREARMKSVDKQGLQLALAERGHAASFS